jgi:hypothetical protein
MMYFAQFQKCRISIFHSQKIDILQFGRNEMTCSSPKLASDSYSPPFVKKVWGLEDGPEIHKSHRI